MEKTAIICDRCRKTVLVANKLGAYTLDMVECHGSFTYKHTGMPSLDLHSNVYCLNCLPVVINEWVAKMKALKPTKNLEVINIGRVEYSTIISVPVTIAKDGENA